MNPKRKIIIFSIIFGIVNLALICFLIFPLIKGIKKNSQDLVGAKKELSLFQAKVGGIEQATKSYEKVKSDLDKIDKLFVDPEVPIDLIKFWEKTAKEAGLTIEISPVSLKKSEADPWNSIGFSLILNGSFPDFLKFLEKIENSSYLIEVQGLTVKDVRLDLTAKVYTK